MYFSPLDPNVCIITQTHTRNDSFWVIYCCKLELWPDCCCVDTTVNNTPVHYYVVTRILRRWVKEPNSDRCFYPKKKLMSLFLCLSLFLSYRMATATITAAVAPSSVCPSQPRRAVPCLCPPPSPPAQPVCPPTTETTATASAAPPGPSRPPPVL